MIRREGKGSRVATVEQVLRLHRDEQRDDRVAPRARVKYKESPHPEARDRTPQKFKGEQIVE